MVSSLVARGGLQEVTLSVLPVIVFLCGLCLLDSYRLVRPASVVGSVLVGVLVAVGTFALVRVTFVRAGVGYAGYSTLAGPAIEETLKFSYLAALIASKRVGFTVGAGFAVVENLIYLATFDATLAVAALRGFGTAVMHGGTAAIAGIVAMRFAEQRGPGSAAGLVAGLAAAVALHAAYNRAAAYPVAAAAAAAIVMPIAIMSFFGESERTLKSWLGTGFDTDAELLEMIEGGRVSSSRIGGYLSSLRDRFPPQVVADMFCLLRIRAELSIRAKGLLLMRRSGFDPPPDPEVEERFREIAHLRRNIGRAGMLAMLPLLRFRQKDLWEINMLAGRR
jgi:hypothetical protein